MIEKLIKEIGMEETWRNIEAQKDCDDSIWLLWWEIQSVINAMTMKIVTEHLKEEGLLE